MRTPDRRQDRLSPEAGYTLTEMLVVIGIIGLIAAVLTPSLLGQMSRARVKAAHLQLQTVSSALEMYMADVGHYPTSQEGLQVLIKAPADADGWTGPYLRDAKVLVDPWGDAIIYAPDPNGRSFQLKSLGSDGKPGGEGAAKDIVFPEPSP